MSKKSVETFLPMSIPKAKKVGDFKEYIDTKDKRTGASKRVSVFYSYRDVEYDPDKWADSSKYLPDDFDLVYMRLERNKTIPGWRNGHIWEGLRLKPDDIVLFWKRKEEEEKGL